MSKKVLVFGDSYARLDPDQGHWANKWCAFKGYDITNFGLGGVNHVSAVNEIFMKQEKFEEYDLIIYCMTNWLRAGVSQSTKTSAFVTRISQFLEDSETITFGSILSTNIKKGFEEFALLSGISDTYYNKDILNKESTQLYKSISIPFLARANLFAVETLILKCKDSNTPLVLATTPEDITTLDNLKKYDVNIFKVDTGEPKEKDLPNAHKSSNHLSNAMHNFIMSNFNTQYGDII